MRGVWKIATIAGIPLQIHWSFCLLFFWIYFEGTRNQLSWEEMLSFGLLLISLFICVIFHEYGHALAARRYGVSTKDITLSPIGGAARLNRLPDKAFHEFVVAAAGPMMNLIIAALLSAGFLISSVSFMPQLANNPIKVFSDPANFFPLLLLLNLFLALFNLIPAFPLDGGRMLRSLLSVKLGRLKATRIASFIGRLIAIVLLGFAIFHGDILFGFISVFVFVMAAHEYYMIRMETVMSSQTIEELVQNHFTPLSSSSNIQLAIAEYNKGQEKNFLVFDESEKLCGILEEKAIQKAKAEKDTNATIEKYLTVVYGAALLEDKLETIYLRMENPVFQVLPVYDAGNVVGIIDLVGLNGYIKKKVRTRFAI